MLRYLSIALIIAALPVSAQTIAFGGVKADLSAPVEVSADSLSVNQSTGVATFTGNVVIGQGDMRLSAAHVLVEYGDGGQRQIRRLHASGGVTLVSGADAAESSEAVYEVGSGKIMMAGSVLLTQGGNVLSGNRLSVDLETGSASVDGRVRTILQPGKN